MKKLPDYIPIHLLDQIKEKTQIAYPGCRFEPGRIDGVTKSSHPPMILWNHRWEHDKNPEDFYDLLTWLKKEHLDFSLVILGEGFSDHPLVFRHIKNEFSDRIKAFGFVSSKAEYYSWLEKADIVVSCATQENFGISVIEAIRYGCLPILPNRLSYPEIIPDKLHSQFIYTSKQECREKTKTLIHNVNQYADQRQILSDHMEQFSWDIRVKQYDNALKKLEKLA